MNKGKKEGDRPERLPGAPGEQYRDGPSRVEDEGAQRLPSLASFSIFFFFVSTTFPPRIVTTGGPNETGRQGCPTRLPINPKVLTTIPLPVEESTTPTPYRNPPSLLLRVLRTAPLSGGLRLAVVAAEDLEHHEEVLLVLQRVAYYVTLSPRPDADELGRLRGCPRASPE